MRKSASYMPIFPVRLSRIDGEIIKEICCDKNCRAFVELINDWCTRQGKEVVGEYVENEAIPTPPP